MILLVDNYDSFVFNLARAEEIFTTNAIRGIRPIASVDGRELPKPPPGPVTRRLQELLEEE